jgi:hypothetical protein
MPLRKAVGKFGSGDFAGWKKDGVRRRRLRRRRARGIVLIREFWFLEKGSLNWASSWRVAILEMLVGIQKFSETRDCSE